MNEQNNVLIRLDGISKRFAGVQALENVSFEVHQNEIVGLLGDNGAGKSTLIRIISGVHRQDEGQIFFEGRPIVLRHPRDALSLGIETVHQSFAGLVDCLNVEKNIFMGREPVHKIFRRIGILDRVRMRLESQKLLQRIGVNISSTQLEIENLSGGQRQAVAIGRSLYFEAKLLLLDEPTAALGVAETGELLDIIQRAKEHLSVIVITHNLDHAMSVSDRFVVMFQGRKIGDRKRKDTDRREIEQMIRGLKECVDNT